MNKIQKKKWLKSLDKLPFDWKDITNTRAWANHECDWESVKGFQFKIGQWEFTCDWQYDCDLEWGYLGLGEFTHDWEPGTITRKHYQQPWGGKEPPFYRPEHTEDDIFQTLYKQGYSKGVAREMARKSVYEQRDRLEAFHRDDWCYVGIIVKGFFTSPYREYEEEHNSSWGYETDSDGRYIAETIYDLALEIVRQDAAKQPPQLILELYPAG